MRSLYEPPEQWQKENATGWGKNGASAIKSIPTAAYASAPFDLLPMGGMGTRGLTTSTCS